MKKTLCIQIFLLKKKKKNYCCESDVNIPADLKLSVVIKEKKKETFLAISGKKKCVQSSMEQAKDFSLALINVSIFMFTETIFREYVVELKVFLIWKTILRESDINN